MSNIVIIGTIVHSISITELQVLENGIIIVNSNGTIALIQECPQDLSPLKQLYSFDDSNITRLTCRQFIFPGFVDTHIHAPQYVYTGTGYDITLLDWLTKYTFPRESEFASVDLANKNYTKAVSKSIKCGTTCACYFGTIHEHSTNKLADVIHNLGQRAFVGKVNMDRNSPDYYIESSYQESLKSTSNVITYIKSLNSTLITPCITPRFVPTCSVELMQGLGELAKKFDIPIQSHLSETLNEIAWVSELHPEFESYSDIYDAYGLFNSKTIMAHCVHLTRKERELIKSRKVGISHCPVSNFCLSSGVLNVNQLLEEGIDKIGLGTDVAGGYSPSILEVVRQAMVASKVVHIQSRDSKNTNENFAPLSLSQVFYLATLGGAKVMSLDDKIGNFLPGKEFDALIIDLEIENNPLDIFPHDTVINMIEKFIYLGDDRNITKVFVQGKQIKN